MVVIKLAVHLEPLPPSTHVPDVLTERFGFRRHRTNMYVRECQNDQSTCTFWAKTRTLWHKTWSELIKPARNSPKCPRRELIEPAAGAPPPLLIHLSPNYGRLGEPNGHLTFAATTNLSSSFQGACNSTSPWQLFSVTLNRVSWPFLGSFTAGPYPHLFPLTWSSRTPSANDPRPFGPNPLVGDTHKSRIAPPLCWLFLFEIQFLLLHCCCFWFGLETLQTWAHFFAL